MLQQPLDRGALVFMILVAVGATALTAMICVRATDGQLVYALDDAYIHLAMGRTFALSGVWGVNVDTPGAASSSPLWTLLLAGLVRLLGDHVWLPLALNLVAVALLAAAADAWLRELGLSASARVAAVVAIIALGPLAPLAMTGMEHVGHAAAVLALGWLALRERGTHPSVLGLMAALATGLRYESAFVAAALGLVLVLRRDWRRAAAVVIGSAALIVAVGAWQVSLGEGFLPNSLVVKAAGVTAENLGPWLRDKAYSAMEHAHEAPVVLLPLLAVLLAYGGALRRNDDRTDPHASALAALETAAALTAATLLHVVLSRTGWYHRYEAYLVIWGVVAAAGSLRAWWRQRCMTENVALASRAGAPATVALVGAGLLVLLAFGLRLNAYNTVPTACRNIYEQHEQVARFVARYQPDGTSPIVLHDIGLVSYLRPRGPLLDLGGLASHEVALAKAAGRMDRDYVERITRERGARIAVSYEHEWVPETWLKVASWRIRDNRVAGSDTVCFYAVDPSAEPSLRAALERFEPELPPGVEVKYSDRPRS